MNVKIDAWAWLPRESLTHIQQAAIKAALTIYPKKVGDFPGDAPTPLKLFKETDTHLAVPRAYYTKYRKPEHQIEDATTLGRHDLWSGPFDFEGTLRSEQQRALREVSTLFRNGEYGGIVRAVTGWGKCLAPDTMVLRYDGEVVRVDSLKVGDLLMGPDSTPRTVLAANAGSGPMYRITPTIGDPWECNDAHILTLVDTATDEIRDIPLQDYLRLSASWKHRLKQFSPANGVDFAPADTLPLDPYFLGVWYGDGTKALNSVAISKPDAEIELLCRDMAATFGLRVRTERRWGCPVHYIVGKDGVPNPLLSLLRTLFQDGETLPLAYMTASRADRQAFLAGWLDSDGYHNNGCYEIVQKRRVWADGVAFLARSLGIRATVREKIVNGESYWRIKLAGDFSQLPMRIARKLPRVRKQKKVATRTGFTVERIEDGAYFGIVLDGDHRYLLGNFTVTHNTVWSCAFMAEMKVPTLVIVHKEFLLNQWKERIEQFLPNVKVGIVQQDRCEYKDAGVMIGMIHSLVGSRDYGKDFWEWPGLIITDETHRVGAETWSAVPTKFKAKWRLGVSATPRRKDGAEDVFFHHIGPVIFTSSEQRMTPKIRRVWTEWKMVQTDTLNPNLVSKSVLLKFLVTNKARNTLIVNQLIQAVEAGRRPMVLSERLQHLDALEAQFKRDWTAKHKDKPVTTGFYVGGMKEDELDESAKATIVFATRQFAEEGLDIPVLDTLFLTIPMSDVEQAVGRILRPCEGKKEPVVVDFRDDKVGYCLKAGGYRDRFYQQKGWSTPTAAPATSG